MLTSSRNIITSKWRLKLALLLLMLFFLKSWIVFWAIPKLSEIRPDFYEEDRFVDEYHIIATNILEGNGYREYPDSAQTLFRLPGYVMILVGIFYFFGKNLFVIKILNILLSISTGYIIIRLYKEVTGHSKGAIFAGLVYLFHPGTVLCETRAATEIVFTFFVAMYILTLYQALKTERSSNYFISGCVLGLSALIRSTPILFPFFLYAFLLFSRKNHRTIKSVTANIGMMIFAMLLVLSPWAIRNYLVSGKLILTTSQPGSVAQETLYKIKNLQTGKPYYELCLEASGQRALWAKEQGFVFRDTFQLSFYSSKDEIAFSKYLSKRVRSQYLEQPSLFIKSIFYNFWWFWFQGRTTASTVINVIITIPLLLLACVGFFICYKYSLNIFPMTLFIIYYVLVHVPLMGYGRFHFPLIPLLAVLVCVPFFHRDRGVHQ